MSSEETTTSRRRKRPRTRSKERRRGGGSRRRGRRTTTPMMLMVGQREDDEVVMETLRLPCTSTESERMNCLNDGQCFVVNMLEGLRTPGCRCTTEWTGRQCERRNYDIDFSKSSRADTYAVGVAFGIVFGFIALFAAVVGAATYCWFKKQPRTNSKHGRPSVVSRDVEHHAPADVTTLTSHTSYRHTPLNNDTAQASVDRRNGSHEKDAVKSTHDRAPLRLVSVESDWSADGQLGHDRSTSHGHPTADGGAVQLPQQ